MKMGNEAVVKHAATRFECHPDVLEVASGTSSGSVSGVPVGAASGVAKPYTRAGVPMVSSKPNPHPVTPKAPERDFIHLRYEGRDGVVREVVMGPYTTTAACVKVGREVAAEIPGLDFECKKYSSERNYSAAPSAAWRLDIRPQPGSCWIREKLNVMGELSKQFTTGKAIEPKYGGPDALQVK
jgi:hypothetical protein